MSDEFDKFQRYLKRLSDIYFYATGAFYAFETLEKLRDPDIVGKDQVITNLRAINRFKGFFVVVRQSLNIYFLKELARMLDHGKSSLHLQKLIDLAEVWGPKMDVEAFRRNNPNRPLLEELSTRYQGITKGDLQKIYSMLDETKEIRERLKRYRDQNVAHEDIEKKSVTITRAEVLKLFNTIKTILNIFEDKTDFSTTSYILSERDTINDTKELIRVLELGISVEK